ncbi:HD-GYP domain-containing protein [Tumebacillus permanentifrigoris]|uniref:HAMP domain-containing protein n=1 Tax=Tumebacillus permanentifrigoris TaxID=378543 RepID=A0A316DFM8_9BACL|nr:HD domain-containing phosphohydrolase [Tumebacillus permanentifrigoris]PWK16029.1 HAMP domain-containing protein [Tumebacillus permanentifrigoris]
MAVYQRFLRILIRNYIIGSTVAVFGIGGLYMFSTLHLQREDMLAMVVILLIAVTTMFTAEAIMFKRYFDPIRQVFLRQARTAQDIERAYLVVHRLPLLTVKRTLGPHLIGFSVPGMSMALLAISNGWLHLPNRFVWLALVGCLLVSLMHAMIEFYLTTEAIRPVLSHLRGWSLQDYSLDLSLHGEVLVSTRRKYTLSALLIGTIPTMLFGLATNVRLAETDSSFESYWQWALIILLLGVGFSAASAMLMSRSVQQPIEELQEMMRHVQRGRFTVQASDLYSDEFSRLISGFNLMVQDLRVRDEMNTQLLESYFSTLAATLDARDPYTAGHSTRVAKYSVQIGRTYGLPPEQLDLLNKSALLHDIGKIGIRDNVLLKEGKLTDEEFAQIKLHPVLGEAILLQIQPAEAMAPLLPGVRSHHERYDGRGYPDGLVGENIPLFGRIMAVADAFDAMTSDRPYRQGMAIEKALAILADGKGTQWDPQFAQLFIDIQRVEMAEDRHPAFGKAL